MVGPSALRTVKASILPGDLTFVDERDGQKGFRPAHEIDPKIQELEGKQGQVRQRVKEAFFVDLFKSIIDDPRLQRATATEIEAKREEKLMMLGPTLEQLNQDLLDPIIDITFAIMLRQGLIPEPPEELQGMELKVEYISIMAQAQKLIGVASIEKFLAFIIDLKNGSENPAVMDKVDLDQAIDTYGDALSVPPDLIRSDEDVAEIREARAKAQQAQAAVEAAAAAGAAAKDMAAADMSGDNALTRLVSQSQAGQLVDQ